jgi:hypothetical protein
MDQLLVRNKLLRFLEDRERTNAELRLALDDVKLWNDGVARGLVMPEQANRYIESAKRMSTRSYMCWDFPRSLANGSQGTMVPCRATFFWLCGPVKRPLLLQTKL